MCLDVFTPSSSTAGYSEPEATLLSVWFITSHRSHFLWQLTSCASWNVSLQSVFSQAQQSHVVQCVPTKLTGVVHELLQGSAFQSHTLPLCTHQEWRSQFCKNNFKRKVLMSRVGTDDVSSFSDWRIHKFENVFWSLPLQLHNQYCDHWKCFDKLECTYATCHARCSKTVFASFRWTQL